MAFGQGLSDEDLGLHEDHKRLVTGTLAASLMGHGYLEDGDTPIDPIMRAWDRFRGFANDRRKENKSMRTGIEMEPIAHDRFMNGIRSGSMLQEDSPLHDMRIYSVFRGMKLDRTKGEGIGIGANIDAPLFDIRGQREDPRTNEMLSMAQYTERAVLEHERIELIKEENKHRAMEGAEEIPLPEKYYELPPFAGPLDIKVTMSAEMYESVNAQGPTEGWIVQLHHYNRELRNENLARGFDAKDYPNQLTLGHFFTGSMEGRLIDVEYDEALELELEKRIDKFIGCVQEGIPPNSSVAAGFFAPYPVKKKPANTILLDPEMEEVFRGRLFERHKLLERQAKIEEYIRSIDESLARGLELTTTHNDQGVFVDGIEVAKRSKVSNRTVVNEAAINTIIQQGNIARSQIVSALEVLRNGDLAAEERVDQVFSCLSGIDISKLPPENCMGMDQFTYKKRTAATEKLTIRDTKALKAVYARLTAKRDKYLSAEVEHEDRMVSQSPSSKGPVASKETEKQAPRSSGPAESSVAIVQKEASSLDAEPLPSAPPFGMQI